MSAGPRGGRGRAAEIARFLEIQNLGLNLPFAIGFLVLAARGVPPWLPTALLLIAFVAARNAGHSFNRWTDRDFDARNPRTKQRALVTGRLSTRFALTSTAVSSTVLFVAAALLNPLALVLAPVALAIVLGYSLTKRWTAWTTVFLGLVESITPAAVFVALTASLPIQVLLAVAALLFWGTAFEVIHSLGDVETDRSLGLPTLVGRLGVRRSVLLLPALHGIALVLLGLFGLALSLRWPYFAAIGTMAIIVLSSDYTLFAKPNEIEGPFRRHFLLSGIFLAGTLLATFAPL